MVQKELTTEGIPMRVVRDGSGKSTGRKYGELLVRFLLSC